MKKTVDKLKEILFPNCAKDCAMIEMLGASECESVCPNKFNEDGGAK